MTGLEGRHAVVTGAASGIGRAAARLLRDRGARVAAIDRNDPGDAADEWIECDVGEFDPTALERLGPTDILINAAGLPPRRGDEAAILRVNAFGLRAVTDCVLSRLVPGGAIVDVSSKAGARWRDNLDQVRRLLATTAERLDGFVREEGIDPVRAYDLSKEAVNVMALLRVADLRRRGLRINAVAPAAIETPILKDFTAAFGERALRGVRIAGREGRPEEVAEVILFLASPAASWVTGCIVECDGGLGAELELERLGLKPASA